MPFEVLHFMPQQKFQSERSALLMYPSQSCLDAIELSSEVVSIGAANPVASAVSRDSLELDSCAGCSLFTTAFKSPAMSHQ